MLLQCSQHACNDNSKLVNLCNILVVAQNEKIHLIILVMILSGHDAVGGLAWNSVCTVRLASKVFGTVECGIVFAQGASAKFITVSSLVTVMAINIERYIGVIHPMYHHSHLKKRRYLSLL